MKYGKLINNMIEYAPYPLIEDGAAIYTHNAQTYLKYGYKKIISRGVGDKVTYSETEDTIYEDRNITLALAIENKLNEIEAYDTSNEVNSFTINGVETWIDGIRRPQLKNSVAVFKNKGQQTYTLCIDNVGTVELDVDTIINILDAVEVYATECLRVTFLHKEAVKQMQTVEEVQNFDITKDYPQKLCF